MTVKDMQQNTQPDNGAQYTRRQFIKLAAVAAGGAVLATNLPKGAKASAQASNQVDPGKTPGTLIDVSRCIGCGACQRACNEVKGTEAPEVLPSMLSATNLTFVEKFELAAGLERNVKRQCMHCLEPACVSACTVGALKRVEPGLVVCDTSKCIGCRYCQYACPFDVPTFGWDGALGVISKCDYCQDRLAVGEKAACTSACPTGALKGGTREEMLAEAHARIKANPDRYVNHVYGEFEVGGTSRLYISDVPFEELGFKDLPEQRVAQYSEPIMKRTPVIALGVATVATGLFSLLGRHAEHGHTDSDSE